MRKPCEYCKADLPEGVDRATRQQRSAHFASCLLRPSTIEARNIATQQHLARQELIAEYGEHIAYVEGLRTSFPPRSSDVPDSLGKLIAFLKERKTWECEL